LTVSIDWKAKVIHVNQVDMVLIQSNPSIIYQHDLNAFRETLKDLEDSEAGMPFPDTHKHNLPVSVGGAVLARVLEFINGYTIAYEETGTPYRVETVGANSNISEVVDLGGGEVSVSTSNSAGLQDLNSLQAASFAGEVTVKPSSSFSGTTFPVGTRGNPVNNMADAHVIADKRGISRFRIIEDITLTSEDFSDSHVFEGDTVSAVTLTIDSGANVSNCTFQNLTIQGTLDNGNAVHRCDVMDLLNLNGTMNYCALKGTVTLGGGSQSTLTQCFSGIAGGGAFPVINLGGSGQCLALRDYSGSLKITNKTGTDDITLDMSSGQIIIDSTVSAGTMTVRGIAKVTDNSTGTFTLINELASNVFANAVWDKDMSGSFATDSAGKILKKIKLIFKILLS